MANLQNQVLKKTFYILISEKLICFKQVFAVFLLFWPLIVCSQGYTETWTGAGTVWSSSICDLTITTSVSGLQNGSSVNFSTGVMGCNPNAYSSNSIVNRGAIAPYLDFRNNGRGILTFTFSQPVLNPTLHIDRLGGGYGFGPHSNSALMTLLTPGLSLTRLSGNGDHFEVTTNTITRTPDQLFGSTTTAECGIPTVGGAAGSVQINGIVTNVSFEYVRNGAAGSADAIEIVWEINCDFDKDGIDDNIDLDDDNDGILDTIEQGDNPLLDSDNDGQIDSRDSDGDGCHDVIEAGFIDQEHDGILGSLPDTVDSDGLIINEPDGYTQPLDFDSNGIPDFQEDTAPIIFMQPTNMVSCEGDNVTISISVQNPAPIQWQVSKDAGLTWVDVTDDGKYKEPHLENLEIQDIALDFDNFRYRAQLEFCNMTILSDSMTLSVMKNPDAGINGIKNFCINDSPENLINSLGGSPDPNGIWSPPLSNTDGTFNPEIDMAGRYTYRVDNGYCQPSESIVIVEVVEKPIITQTRVVDFSDNNTITIEITGNGIYEYSINGFDYQENPFFDNLLPGNYMIYIKDKLGCYVTTTTVDILGYPKFFTPNNDGYNDYWNIQGIFDTKYTVSIYNRYGKLLKILNNGSFGWDGKYNNVNMPSSDYWFKFTTTEGTIKIGHFALKR